jgi:class 3 adenylate cyclase
MSPDPSESVSLEEWVRARGGSATLVFTDVVRSTLLLYGTGSMSYMQVIQEHRDRARKLIESLDGRVIDMSGDAVFAAFDRAVDAFRYASSIAEDTGNERVRVRVGVHHGAVHASEDGLFGRAVHYVARLASRAGDSEVWASDAARHALETDAPEVVGELPLRRYRDYELEGIPGRHTLWLLARKPPQAPAQD